MMMMNFEDSLLKRLAFAGSNARAEEVEVSKKESAKEGSVNSDNDRREPGETGKGTTAKGGIGNWLSKLQTAEDGGDQKLSSHHCRVTFVNRLFRDVYGPFLLTRGTKLYVLLCYSLYALFALVGVSRIKEGLSPRNLVRSSFYLTEFYVLIDETFWQEGLQLQVVVNRPPDLANPTQRARLDQLVAAFEGTEFTMRHNATMFWLNAFDAHLAEDLRERNISLPDTSDEWYRRCKDWLLTAGGRRLWELDMDWAEGEGNADGGSGGNDSSLPLSSPRLRAFRFQIGLRHYRTPTDHTNGCRLMRSIAEQFPEFNVTTFQEYYPFADQYLELKPALFRNCALAVLCMMAVSLLMIPSWSAAFAITAAIISIDIGVLGYMSLWGVNLESVSMITIIMSIGFSVDLSAHIAYAFVKAPDGLSRNEKAIAALETLGWPVFLGAFSTIAGIMVLTLVDAPIILIFFKTIFLVITFSLLHGIVFLPILMTVVMPATREDGRGDGRQQKEEEEEDQQKQKEDNQNGRKEENEK